MRDSLNRLVVVTAAALTMLGCGGSAGDAATPTRPSDAGLRASAPAAVGLAVPREKEIAMELVSSAENSTLDWRSAYSYVEDIGDGRGYTAGLIGFCTGTGDLRQIVEAYHRAKPHNVLARFRPALRRVDGTDSHAGLGRPFVRAWKRAAKDPVFRRLQVRERDRVYFDPAVRRARADGLGTLGQFVYYDAMVMHGPVLTATASAGSGQPPGHGPRPRPTAGRRCATSTRSWTSGVP